MTAVASAGTPRQRGQRARPAAGSADLLAAARQIAAVCAARAAANDAASAFPAEEFALLARAGLLTAPLSVALGGQDLRLSAGGARPRLLLAVLRAIGYGSLPVGRLYEGHVNALELIQLYGTPAQRERCAEEARAGLRFGVWAADDRAAPVQLTPSGDGGVLRGVKNFCSGAGAIERAIVPAQLPNGAQQLTLLAMEQGQARIDSSWWRPLGMGPSVSGRVDFGGVEIAASNLLGAAADYLREPHFRGGAVRFAAVHQGGAEALFDTARAYLASQSDDALVAARIGEMAIAVESGALWIARAARAWRTPLADPEGLALYADLTRSALLDSCSRLLALVERALGASALIEPQPFARLLRDLTMYLHQPAPDRALLAVGRQALARQAPAATLWDTSGGEHD